NTRSSRQPTCAGRDAGRAARRVNSRTMSTATTDTPNSFEELGLAPDLLQAVRTAGYQHPTPIQARTIPLILRGRDVIRLAQTGTGKTAAFTLPIVHRLL